MLKRLFSAFLALILLVGLITPATTHAAANTAYVLEDQTVRAEEEFEVEVAIAGNPGIISLRFKVNYDETVLELISVEDQKLLNGFTTPAPEIASPYTLRWADSLASSNNTKEGVVVKLKFKALKETSETIISIEHSESRNYLGKKVSFEDASAAIKVDPAACKHPQKTTVAAKAPDCTTAGNNLYYICKDCGQALKADGITETTAEAEKIAATGHSYKAVVTAPTCTEQGYTTHTCANCGDSYKDTYVAAKGHSFGNWTVTKAPTCTAKGTEQRKCACGQTETRDVAATGHDYKAVVTAPTCTEQGYTTHTCANCGDFYVDSYVAAKGHSFGNWTVTKAPTCTAKGTEQRKCACGQTETRDVAATGHDYKAVVTAPTCTEQGYTTHTCANCKDSYKDTYTEKLGHNYGEWTQTKAPTLEAEGEERRDCSRCDDYQIRKLPKLVHTYQSVVTAPTCTAQGYTTHTCTNCGDTYVDTYVDALGHSFKNYTSDGNATCTSDGTKTAKCERCDAKNTVADVGSAKGHTFGSWTVTVKPTCTAKGTERRDCNNCSYFEVRDVEALGHSYKAVVTAPTCTAQGYTTHTCERCGDRYLDTYVKATGHSFGSWTVIKNATCTTAGTQQRKCGKCAHTETQEIEAIGHNYKHVVTVPTCTEQGYTTHTCANCQDSYKDTYVDAKGHSFGNWTVTKAPTCTTKGSEQRKCACGQTETREVAATGHNYKAVVTAATCTEQGYTTHTCANCKDSYKDTYTEKLGHNYGEWTQTKAPTLEAEGEERRDCTRCDDYQTRKIPMLKHNYTSVITAPTCTEQGYTTHTCADCGDSYKDTYVDALGHSFKNYTSDGNATCTTDGTKTAKCERCAVKDTVTDTGSAKGHNYGSWTVTVKPTCTAMGSEQRKCSNCTHTESREVAAIGHNYKHVVTAPTCTERGYTTHTCANCSNSYVDTYVAAKGHNYGSWTTVKAPTCTNAGNEQRECSNCGSTESREVAAIGHNYKHVVTAPTCTERGYTTHTCANCQDAYVDSYVAAKGHSYGSWTVTEAPTCTAKGSEKRTCQNCTHSETREVAAIGHNYKHVVTAATCTEQGYTTHTCANCQDSYKDTYTEKMGHSYGEWIQTKAPTLEAEGEERRDCSRCDDYQTRKIPMLKHNYTSVITAPTCTEQGYTTHTCADCGDSYKDTYVDALGHSFKNYTSDGNATCTADGTKTAKCERCDVKDTVTDTGSAKGHSYGSWTVTVKPTCTAKGTEQRKCNNCTHTESREVAATGHNYQEKVTAPTCTEKGYTTHTCANCQDSYVDHYVDVIPHSWDSGKVTKEPTEKETGIRTFTCTVCKQTRQETIPTLDHVHKYTETVTAPTCTEQGYTTHACACGESYKDTYVNAIGHKYESVITDPTCEEKGYTTHTCSVCQDSYVDSYTEIIEHVYVNGICSVCGAKDEDYEAKFEFYGSSMTLGNKLDINFFIYQSDIGESTGNYAVITKHYAGGRDDVVVTVKQENWNKLSGLYYFTFSGVRAKEMADKIDVVIYNAKGEAISEVFTDSVQGYARRMLDKAETSATHRTLYIEMLNYGSAAQVEFKYDAGNLANRVITAEEQAAYGMKDRVYENHRQNDAAYYGTTLTLENQIVFNIFFNGSYVPEGAYAVATFTNHKGQKMEEKVTSFATVANWKYASFKSLVVADCSELITVKLYDADGKLISTVVDSIEGYAARMTSVGPLYEAIMKFADAAYQYFHS